MMKATGARLLPLPAVMIAMVLGAVAGVGPTVPARRQAASRSQLRVVAAAEVGQAWPWLAWLRTAGQRAWAAATVRLWCWRHCSG